MKSKVNKIKKQSGITLIALVITIIVLLILAGVSIAMLTGENGILTKASTANEETKKQSAIEKVKIAVGGSYGVNGIDLKELKDNLNNVEGIEKITEDITSLPYEVIVDGYKIIVSWNGKVDFTEGGNWTGVVNTPKLTSDMTPIYWDSSNNEVETNASDTNWYDYNNKKWANAKTSDGSYWVWIPRYEYQIKRGEGTSTAGEIDVKFISTETKTADVGYKIHPVFQNGTANNFANGEWDKELSGIWVMKFEASSEAPETTDGGGNVKDLKVKSVPGVPSWRSITIGNSYINSYNYDRAKDSHMIKNSEWGAIAYLTQSKYGRNGIEISVNENTGFYTGGGSGDDFKNEVSQSTTENVYGIYDLSGGNWERVAAYIANGNVNLKECGESFANATISNKYLTIYPYDSANDIYTANFEKFKEYSNTRYGDAILETSASGADSTSWFSDYSKYPDTIYPFLKRGGHQADGTNAGIFSLGRTDGAAYNNQGFRTCLAF